jgi:hypothetical protein
MSPNTQRPSTRRTRRGLLARSGAALAASLALSSAGCLSRLPPLGGEQRYGRLGVPPAGDPWYRRWLPAPTAVDDTVETYHVVALMSPVSRPDAPEKFVAGRARLKASLDCFGIGFERYDRVLTCPFGTVVEASFDRQTVARTLTASGYERTGEYRGYATFARDDVARRAAVGDGVVVWTSAFHHDAPNLAALVDAGAGARPRYHEADDGFAALTTAAGGTPPLGVNTATADPTGRPAMLADAFRFDDETAYQLVHYRYRDPDRVPTRAALERALRADDYRFVDGAETFDVTVDGRLATVETQVPLTDARAVPPEYDRPQVTWGVERDGAGRRVTFRHDAGESVPADQLFYDLVRPAAPGRIQKRPLWQGSEAVEAGGEATVDLRDEPDATGVQLVYSTRDVGFHVLLGVDLRGESDG